MQCFYFLVCSTDLKIQISLRHPLYIRQYILLTKVVTFLHEHTVQHIPVMSFSQRGTVVYAHEYVHKSA